MDDIRQCIPDGEIDVPLREGLIAEADVAGEIGKVICGELEAAQSDDQVTVFDSTGIALQDSATVPLEDGASSRCRHQKKNDLDVMAAVDVPEPA